MQKILLLISLILFFSCTQEKPADISTSSPVQKDTTSSIHPAQADEKTVPSDDKSANTPPEISRVKIMPELFKAGDTLSVDVSGKDIDGDDVIIIYEWQKNGEPAGNDKKIGLPVRRGDKVIIKITPFDGKAYGQPVVLRREIRNLPPMIIENNNFYFEGNQYSYMVKATDPDNDILSYSLKAAPEGMTIEKSTGHIQWKAPEDFAGNISFSVSVTDGYGGEAVQDFNFKTIYEK